MLLRILSHFKAGELIPSLNSTFLLAEHFFFDGFIMAKAEVRQSLFAFVATAWENELQPDSKAFVCRMTRLSLCLKEPGQAL